MSDKMNPEVFLTVADTGSFRRAADLLGYTQAGVSYIISAMEENTGLNMFIRERNGVRLSPEGEAILPQMKQLAIWQRQFQQTVTELNGLAKGTVRVQIFDSISVHWIPNIIRQFHDDYPGIQIELITEEDSTRAEEMILNGTVDCGFLWRTTKGKLDSFPLMKDKLLAVVSPEHPLAKKEYFPLAELKDYPYIAMNYDASTEVGRLFRKCGVRPRTVFVMDNDYAAMAMVSQNLGYGIFPALLLQDAPYELHTMEFDDPQYRVISLCTVSMDTCSRACAKFMEYTRRWIRENYKEE